MIVARLVMLSFIVFAQGCSASAIHQNKNKPLRSDAAAADDGNCDTFKAIIVMSKGRSGSNFVLDVIARTFKNPNYWAQMQEILGGNKDAMEKLSNPLEVIQKHICRHGANHNYVSFKWKPSLWNDAYMEALQWVAKKKIPVVLNVRNPIDRFLSLSKHKVLKSSHCKPGNAECLARFKEHELVEVNATELVQHLRTTGAVANDNDRALLVHYNVHFIPIEYETLIADETAALRLWTEIFEFIAPARDWSGFTMRNVTSVNFVATSSSNHRDKIKNYDEVRAALRGTRFASLLQ
jgi:hypothetical protein